jgi:AcrR family transcriptional regulator
MQVTTPSTKERILLTAVHLFSETSYDKVSMRDIADKVGIKASSIYNHFPSKQDILLSMYEFYGRQKSLAAPILDDLLLLVETEPLHKVFEKIDYHYPAEIQSTMDRVLIVASQRIYTDEYSERFIRKYLFESSSDLMLPLLNHMIEIGKIEPLDTVTFSSLLAYYAYSTAVLNHSALKIGLEQWQKGLGMLFSLLKTTENA